MSNLIASNTQTSKQKTYTFNTKETYVEDNIALTVDVQDGAVSGSGGSVVANSNATLSTTNTSGISVTGSGNCQITQAGWIDAQTKESGNQTKYLTGVKLTNNKQFTINDGLNTWTWTVDAAGNVTIE